MSLRDYMKKKLEKQNYELVEGENYPVRTKYFLGMMFMICLHSFGTGFILFMIIASFGEDTMIKLSPNLIGFSFVCLSALIIPGYFLYYKKLKHIVKNYEDKYGSSGAGDEIKENESKRKNKSIVA